MRNTDNINMKGIEINDEIVKALKNFKQGKLLESNYLQVQHVIPNEMLEYLKNIDVVEISKREMIQKISHELMEKYKDSFEERQTPFGKEFSLSMLCMSMQELKHLVDYCVRTMPESAIQEIRK
jgi:hypothetical protein